MRVGSLCSGYGGLDLAVGGDLQYVAEIDPHASTVLAERFPGVPNLGDLTTADPESVDLITAGFPCQPVSVAGRRAGTEDERWLWDDIAAFVRRMEPRPSYLFFENVAGLLTANNGRAVARVLHDLAALGFDAEWGTVRAADVGACHRRERWFCLATNPDRQPLRPEQISERRGNDPVRAGHDQQATAHAQNVRHERAGSARRRGTGPADGGDSSANTDGQGSQGHGGSVERPREQSAAQSGLQPAAADPNSAGQQRLTQLNSQPETRQQESQHRGHADRLDDQTRWGNYSQAISQWAEIIGRPAPDPTNDRGRLNPAFVEWMMGLPAGWVTDIDLSRAAQLRILGNGVVPQQAAAAFDLLTNRLTEKVAA